MSVIEKLDSVLAKWHENAEDNAAYGELLQAGKAVAYEDCADDLDALMPAIRQDMIDARRYRELAVMEDQPWVTFKFQADGLTAYGPVLPRNRKPWLDAAIDARLASDSATGEGEGHD